MRNLRNKRRYTELRFTKELLGFYRDDIVTARLLLTTKNYSTVEQQAELWQLIDSGELFLKMLAEDYEWQLEQIDRELELELQR